MIDRKQLRADPDRFRVGAREKGIDVDFDTLLALDERLRGLEHERGELAAEQNRLGKDTGRQIGQLKGRLKKASEAERAEIEAELRTLEARPTALKAAIQESDRIIAGVEPELRELLLKVPLPADPDVPKGASAEDNVELRRWSPAWFDPARSFRENKGFDPRSHVDLMLAAGMVDFERAVKIAGARHYALRGDGMRLHQAVLRFGLDTIVNDHGFVPVSVPVIVREECMVGTGFFPTGRDQAYHIEESRRGAGHDLFLTGTGEVGLMGLHAGEILDAEDLPLQYATVSTCFRREAGAAGKDTAGLYRVHQFDKVEQVVITHADEAESRRWHATMIGIVEQVMQRLELPHRLLQCCTGDLGPKNADMIDVEAWMPSRGEEVDGVPAGAWGESHSASRLYDYQCRRLNLRYRGPDRKPVVCHSLNNTVIASPRILIPIVELYQNADGSITVPAALRPYLGGVERLGG
ncbi:MAG: serine--tRNA ligase [Phycisphaerales bacterium]|nr:serine--tRNA ligase [Phycisphaerae bacterium]NNF41514.1 serine--tRNA ligase [Phycisphaerales bacterium]NNM26117.1 serine--tRNA ligase [Phycisphaerales bacterium]